MVQRVMWPRNEDYIDAIQTPQICFSEPRLQNAVFESDGYGIPVVATGKSAIVFHASVNSADVALRCFTRGVLSQKVRYEKLNTHLKEQSKPGYFVTFAYQDSEILVGDKRYPIVEMGWSEGRALNRWLESHLKRGADVAKLADSWLTIVNDLQDRDIAHGDLANDNCLVNGSGITLIDYDSCFISALANEDPGEAGNPHFQHPQREGYYALDMDAFSAVVIYLSLLALSKDKSLWKFNMKENLIFRAGDYKAPGETPIWNELTSGKDPQVRALTHALADMCTAPIASLPSLRNLLYQPSVHGSDWVKDWSAKDGQPSAGEADRWWEEYHQGDEPARLPEVKEEAPPEPAGPTLGAIKKPAVPGPAPEPPPSRRPVPAKTGSAARAVITIALLVAIVLIIAIVVAVTSH